MQAHGRRLVGTRPIVDFMHEEQPMQNSSLEIRLACGFSHSIFYSLSSIFFCFIALILTPARDVLWGTSAHAAPPEPGVTEAVDDDETEPQQAARKKAESVKVSALADGTARDLELVPQPVLRFGDIPRANDKGSVWIWQREGLPQAIMELYRGADGRSW